MKKLTLQDLRDNGLIIYEVIAGSHAYGTATETSDTDIRGVFMQPIDKILGLEYDDQVSDEMNDITFYELGKFLELIYTNNPNIIELLNTPEDCVIYKAPIFDMILENRDKFISKLCKNSFGGYATQQIKKARGLNKKIVKQFDEKRKSILEFCFVQWKQGSINVKEYLRMNDMVQDCCGLVALPHMKNTYGVYYNRNQFLAREQGILISDYYRGIVSDEETAMDVSLSNIPSGIKPDFLMQFNMEGYSVYCKEYKEYWEWVAKRNVHRFNDNMLHGKGYDGKNLAHTLRLLEMSLEIAQGKGINVRRTNRDKLLAIRKGEYEYEDLVNEAEDLMKQVNEAFDKSDMQESPDRDYINNLLISMRWKNCNDQIRHVKKSRISNRPEVEKGRIPRPSASR